MKTKRIICIILTVVMICTAAACAGSGGTGDNFSNGSGGGDTGISINRPGPDGNDGNGNGSGSENGGNGAPQQPGGGDSSSNLTGTPVDILSRLVDDLNDAGVEMPMSLPPTEVAADISHNTMGLSEDDFERLVVSAAYNLAAIGTFAHQIIVVQANDTRAAAEVKRLVSADNGYDAKKWVCVFPDSAATVDSGDYVLIVASYNEVVDAAIEAFRASAGSIGEVITFWEFAGGDFEGGDLGGGLGGGMGIEINTD